MINYKQHLFFYIWRQPKQLSHHYVINLSIIFSIIFEWILLIFLLMLLFQVKTDVTTTRDQAVRVSNL